MKKKILIDGMSCQHCVKHVNDALVELNGVTNVNVDLDSKSAVIEVSSDVKDEEIKDAIEDAGYDVVKIEEI